MTRNANRSPGGTVQKLVVRAQNRLAEALDDPERGDVPGWVLITIMTAGLVTVVWAVADDQLQDILDRALNSVKDPGGS
jgi:hypothetical protein